MAITTSDARQKIFMDFLMSFSFSAESGFIDSLKTPTHTNLLKELLVFLSLQSKDRFKLFFAGLRYSSSFVFQGGDVKTSYIQPVT
jgi:hypothetical protein